MWLLQRVVVMRLRAQQSATEEHIASEGVAGEGGGGGVRQCQNINPVMPTLALSFTQLLQHTSGKAHAHQPLALARCEHVAPRQQRPLQQAQNTRVSCAALSRPSARGARTCTVHMARLPASVPYSPAPASARPSLKRVSASREPMMYLAGVGAR